MQIYTANHSLANFSNVVFVVKMLIMRRFDSQCWFLYDFDLNASVLSLYFVQTTITINQV